MRFKLSLRGVVGGEAMLATGEPGVLDGRDVVITRSRTETVGLVAAIKEIRDDVISHIEVVSGKPLYHHADIKFGAKEAVIETRFEGHRVAIDYTRKGRKQRTYRLSLPGGDTPLDPHSVLARLRGWNPADGEQAYFYVISGRRPWRNRITATRREEVRTALGSFRALRIDGVGQRLRRNFQVDSRKRPRKFTIWISDDLERRPLRVVGITEYGNVQAELVEHRLPETHLVRR